MARPRKPSKVKQIQGTERKCRVNGDEPDLPTAFPPPPDGLDDAVKAAYLEHGHRAMDQKVLTEVDGGALLSLARAFVDREKAAAELAKFEAETGSVYIRGKMIRPHPALAVLEQADKRYKGWLTEFGLSPASRSKVSAKKDDKPRGGLAKVLEMRG